MDSYLVIKGSHFPTDSLSRSAQMIFSKNMYQRVHLIHIYKQIHILKGSLLKLANKWVNITFKINFLVLNLWFVFKSLFTFYSSDEGFFKSYVLLFLGLFQERLLWSTVIFNRPGVAGAVLQTPSSPINSLSQPFPPNLQATFNPKP